MANATVIAQFESQGTYTWVPPGGVSAASTELWGSGGGADQNFTGGGGGGEYAAETTNTVISGDSYTVTIGAGGTGNITGGSGGSSSFSGTSATTVTAHGGTGSTGNAGGAGGTGSSNSVHFNGGAGGTGSSSAAAGGGGGSATASGAGSNGTAHSSNNGGAGGAGAGGGGGGSGALSAGNGAAGGNGSVGGGGGGGCFTSGSSSGNGGTGPLGNGSGGGASGGAGGAGGGPGGGAGGAGRLGVGGGGGGGAFGGGGGGGGNDGGTGGDGGGVITYSLAPGTAMSAATTGGVYTWTCPTGITSVSYVITGTANFNGNTSSGIATVVPGTAYTFSVGAGSLTLGWGVTSDLPAAMPGATWLAHFKPGWPQRRPLTPPSGPYFGNLPNLSDQNQAMPGPVWLANFRHGSPRVRPFLPSGSGITSMGSAQLQPYATSGTGSVTPGFTGGANLAPYTASGAVGVPVVASGSATLAPYKTSGAVGVPVVASGSATLAPYAVQTPSYLRDLPVARPGAVWLNRFKPGMARALKIPGGPGMMGARGSASLAAYATAGQAIVYLPFPQFNLSLMYEMLVNGTWTDITAFVYWRDDQVINRGLPNETQTVNPSTMTLTLNNRDGRFSVLNSGGAYYPYLTRNVQVRCSVVNQASASGVPYTGYRFWGELSSDPPAWDPTGSDVYCQVTVSGPLQRYVQGAKMGSALRQYYSSLTGAFAPYAAWPCEDGGQATQIASLLAAVGAMSITGTPAMASNSAFGGSDPIPALSGSTWHGVTGADANPPGTGSITQKFPGTYTFIPPPGVTQVTGVTATGSGGGGGDTDGTTGGGGGGGGGSQTSATVAVTAGQPYTYVVPPGGAAGAAGTGFSGAPASFTGDSATVAGGGGAGGSYAGSGGAGGTGAHHGGAGGTGKASSTSSGSSNLFGSSGATGGGQGTSSSFSGGSDAGGNSAVWTAPSGVSSVDYTLQAGGGGGGPGDGSGGGGGGGEGGQQVSGSSPVTAGQSYLVAAGNGGAGASGGEGSPSSGSGIGTQGGSSSFDSNSAQGGVGGAHSPGSSGAGGPGGSGHANNTGAGFYGGGGGGGGAGAGSGGDSPGRGGGAGSGGGGNGGSGKVYPNGAPATPGGTGSGGGGGGGGGSSNTLGGVYGANGGGGGGGSAFWSWTRTGAPTGGGGGSSAGTSLNGGNGSSTGTGGSAPAGGGKGGSAGATPAGTAPGGGGAGAVPGDSASPSGNGAAGQVTFSWSGGATSPVAADIVRFLLDVDPAGAADGAVLLRILTYGTVAQVDVVYHTGGHLELIGYNASSAQVFDSGSTGFSADGTPLYVSVELTAAGSSVDWKLTAVKPGAGAVVATASGAVTGQVGNVSDVITDPAGTVTDSGTALGWITVQAYADTLVNVSPIAAGYAGELASVRLARLCAAQGLDFELVGNDSDTPRMGPQQDDTFVNVLQSCADLDRGQLYETRDAFGLGYRTRTSMQGQDPALIASYAAGTLAAALRPVADDQFTRNDITVTRNGGASATAVLSSSTAVPNMSTGVPPNGVGDYTYTLTVQAFADAQLANLGAWLLTVGTVGEYRFPVIPFDMSRAAVQDLFAQIPSLDIGDFIQVPDPPPFLQTYPVNQLCWGYTETLNSRKWTFAFNAVPESPYAGSGQPTW